MKYIRSNLLWCGVILLVKGVYYVLRLIRLKISHDTWIGPPRIWDKPTKERALNFNKNAINQVIYKKVYDENNFHHSLPKTIDSTIHPRFLSFANEPQFEQFVAQIPNGKIAGTYTTITPDHRILWDSVGYLHENIYSNPYSYKIKLGSFEKRNGTIAVLTGNDSFRNYNHWMTFGLPKYHLIQQSGLKVDYYITDHGTKYHKESLAAIGLSVEKMIIPNQDTRIQADNLIITSTTTISGNIPQWTVSFLRDTFLKNIVPTQSNKKKRIFLSRITNRKVHNEVEIMAYLSILGFERVVLDTMSIHEQAQLFESAEIVVGPHGAGFTNLVFCSPGTKVIELFQPKTVWGHYYCLAATCSLDYAYIMGEELVQQGTIRMDNDMIISLEKMQKTLHLMEII